METNELEQLKQDMSQKLRYKYLSALTRKEYREFIFNFFKMLSLYKAKGLKDTHLKDFINKLWW